MIRPGRMWSLVRRDLGRGWQAARHEYFTLPRIREWSWPFWDKDQKTVPIHILAGAADWQMCAWTLASLIQASEHSWPVVVHDDGTLPEDARGSLMHLFPQARVITRKEADKTMERVLKAYPFCLEYRAMQRLGLKVFDFAHFASGNRYIILDPAVLFFRYPVEILRWAETDSRDCLFAKDAFEGSLLTSQQAKTELDVELWPRVSTGIALIQKSAVDLDLCDRALAETTILRGAIARVEQTLLAICASRYGEGGLLPPEYEVSQGKHASTGIVARYYVDAVRNRFYAEGLRQLAPVLLAPVA
jgi:hypothetical protein